MAAGNDEHGLETPLADLAEQLIPVDDDADPADDGVGSLADLGDADEADMLEQSIAVPVDEDYPGDGR